MTNEQIYKKIMYIKNKKDLTYQNIADKLGTKESTICDKFMRIKNGRNVSYKFLLDLEKVFGESIFFDK